MLILKKNVTDVYVVYSWQSLVNDTCQPDLRKSPCTFSVRRKKQKYVTQLQVQGDQSLQTVHCSSQWLGGRRSIPEVRKVLQTGALAVG